MYIPKLYRNENRSEILQFIREYNFGILISCKEGERILATHIPFHIEEQEGKLVLSTHVSKANPQWKSWNELEDVLIIFQGPHTYISSSWYDHINVPTWNYIAVHLYGKLRILNEEETLIHLNALVDYHEKNEVNPTSTERMGAEYITKEMKGLMAVEIVEQEIFSVFKLSQNRDIKNLDSIIDALEQRGDENSLAIAEEMKKVKSSKSHGESSI